MKNMIKDALILFAITLVAGLLLGLVNDVTKEPIAIAKENAKQAAYKEVFPNADEFREIDIDEAVSGAFTTETGYRANDFDAVLEAYLKGERLGFVILVTNHEGYGGDIQMAVGISGETNVLNGISILSINETAGLGMEAPKQLVPQFNNVSVDEAVNNHSSRAFEYTKSGSTNPMEIDAISGATITTKAVLSGVNAAVSYYEETYKKEAR